MPRLVDSAQRGQELTDAVTRLVAHGGIAAVSMRSVASEMRMSVAGLAGHVTRDKLLAISAFDHGPAMVQRIVERPPDQQLAAFIPVHARAEPGQETTDPAWDVNPFETFRPFGVVQMRVWLVWCNLAHSDPAVAEAVESVRQRQLLVLHELLSGPHEQLDALLAVIDGLRSAVCRSVDPMPREAASRVLREWVERTFVQSAA